MNLFFSEVSWSIKPFQLGFGLCLSALWNISNACHNSSTLSIVLKIAIFSLMSLSGLSIIFETEWTFFCWYQLGFIESFLSTASLLKLLVFTPLFRYILIQNWTCSFHGRFRYIQSINIMAHVVCYKLCKPIFEVIWFLVFIYPECYIAYLHHRR